MTNIELIEKFVDAWNRLDLAEIESMMADDIYYHNIPMEPLVGIPAFRKFMEQMPAQEAEWIVHAIAETGSSVLTERTDKFRFGDKWMSLPVMGIFEIENGKIAKWRDYFDLQQMSSQLEQN